MSFLKKIDILHETCRKVYGIDKNNKIFSSFINIEPVEKNLTQKFVIKKQEKSKLLVVSGNQRVYLSDYSIISTILRMDHDDIEWFLKEFIKAYNNEYEPFKFKIEDEVFEVVGINYYPKLKNIHLFSDTEIEINDLVFVINFIFSKDMQWERDKSLNDFRKNTIVKYITLIDYYSNNSERSRNFLSSIGYSIEQSEFVENMITKNMFLKVNSFDISQYI